jgi:hypothetical protein
MCPIEEICATKVTKACRKSMPHSKPEGRRTEARKKAEIRNPNAGASQYGIGRGSGVNAALRHFIEVKNANRGR